jgi:hypothetical protein
MFGNLGGPVIAIAAPSPQLRSMAPKMVNTPGNTLFLKNTGHSIHDERPRYLASRIVEFLG